ncbi:Aste57867_15793 [Aphanomyces stellatus]|uniref:Phosphatidate cytidylyltransferase n=1 Tax=Aphanomyces stellatus TaxID=120398 RepID=A0A485L3X6_9STRA|nr:hypothetical protein As57867_015737 [Aphanomyces stellatus]VFT92581.1 Aste57867_15793 [Aphanomyces stellatus]
MTTASISSSLRAPPDAWGYSDVADGQMTADIDEDHASLEGVRQNFKGQEIGDASRHVPTSSNAIIALWQTNNMVQRIISGLLLGAAVTVYLILGPSSAPIYLCSFVVAICNYEYAWLTHRIAYRFSVTYAHQAAGDDAASEIAPLDLTSVAASRLPLGTRHPKLVAGAAAFVVAGAVTAMLLLLQHTLFHYQTVSYINIYQQSQVYTWVDFVLLMAISTWGTIFCALLTPTPASAINHVLQMFVYSLSVLNFFTCQRYDTKCYQLMQSFGGRLNVVLLVLMNRVPWWRKASQVQAVDAVMHVMLDIVGFAYIAMLMSPVSSLLMEVDQGARIALGFLAVVWGVDTGAYFCGHLLKSIGYTRSHFLARHISPNKDIEGSVGGIIIGLTATLLVDALWTQTSGLASNSDLDAQNRIARVWRIVFAVVGGAISRYGDLFASLLKRLAGVKDTGTLIPGHGGLLDRVDAMLFLGAIFSLYHRFGFFQGYDSDISQAYQNLVYALQSVTGAMSGQ